jgi:hypothetical protein
LYNTSVGNFVGFTILWQQTNKKRGRTWFIP